MAVISTSLFAVRRRPLHGLAQPFVLVALAAFLQDWAHPGSTSKKGGLYLQ